jgi:hypothetical protein
MTLRTGLRKLGGEILVNRPRLGTRAPCWRAPIWGARQKWGHYFGIFFWEGSASPPGSAEHEFNNASGLNVGPISYNRSTAEAVLCVT